jgi:hypothetical protein
MPASGLRKAPVARACLRAASLLAAIAVAACGGQNRPDATGASPAFSLTQTAASSVSSASSSSIATPASTTTPVTRISLSSTALPSDTRPYLLFQLHGETHLRAIAWDASISGVLPGQIASQSGWPSQSPDGERYIVDGKINDRAGQVVASVPWPGKQGDPTWSSDGKLLCEASPAAQVTGSLMRLETDIPGQPLHLVAQGYGIFSDNAAYPVLACDTRSDRAVVASLGQGVALSQLWIFRLSTGAMIRSASYDGASAAVTSDATVMAESVPQTEASWLTTIRRVDDSAPLATIPDFSVHGFSGDGSLLVGVNAAGNTIVVDWRSGKRVWTSPQLGYGGMLAEPNGKHLAVGFGFVGGSDGGDIYIVSSDGSATLLPRVFRAALHY